MHGPGNIDFSASISDYQGMDSCPVDPDAGEMGVGDNLGAYGLLEFYETTIPQEERGLWKVEKLWDIPDFLGAGTHVVFAYRADTNEYLLRPLKSQRIIRVPASMVDAKRSLGYTRTTIALAAAGVLSFVMCLIHAGGREEEKLRDPVPVVPADVKQKIPEHLPAQELDIDWKRRVAPFEDEIWSVERADEKKKEYDRNPLINPNNPTQK